MDLETRLSELRAEGALAPLATLAIEGYSPELYGFLINVMGAPSEAGEVLSQTIEDFWRGLPEFRGRCSVRTWLYLLAQHAISRYRRSPWNRGMRTGDDHLDGLVDAAHSRTAPWQQTEVKDKWHELRRSLDPEDRTLLVLRVDRDLEWSEIARIVLGSDDPEQAELAREAARLRKRFQLLKDELRVRARAAGLIESS